MPADPTWRRLINRLLGHLGLELRPARSHAAAVTFDPVSDSIYSHSDSAFMVPIERCYYPYGYSYGTTGWHPFVATLLEYIDDPRLTYRDSTLYRYYDRVQPATVRSLLFEPGSDRSGSEPLDAYALRDYEPMLPWGTTALRARGEKGLDHHHGHQGFGPVSSAKGNLEFRRLVETFRSIEERGYEPVTIGNGHIRGYFLKMPTDYRFVIRAGLHRTAALAALGYAEVPVGFLTDYPRAIHLSDIESWPLVHGGVYSLAAAQRYFLRFFEEDGRRKAGRLGLLRAHELTRSG